MKYLYRETALVMIGVIALVTACYQIGYREGAKEIAPPVIIAQKSPFKIAPVVDEKQPKCPPAIVVQEPPKI